MRIKRLLAPSHEATPLGPLSPMSLPSSLPSSRQALGPTSNALGPATKRQKLAIGSHSGGGTHGAAAATAAASAPLAPALSAGLDALGAVAEQEVEAGVDPEWRPGSRGQPRRPASRAASQQSGGSVTSQGEEAGGGQRLKWVCEGWSAGARDNELHQR